MKDETTNRNRVERIMSALNCETTTDLVTHLNRNGTIVYSSNIYRWSKNGMYKSTATLIDALLETIEYLEKKEKD